MTGLLVQLALGNLLASALLASTAYLVHRHARYPALAHLLWVIVLAKLVTPPLVLLPLLPPASPEAMSSAAQAGDPSAAWSAALGGGNPDTGVWLAEHGVVLPLVAWAIGSAVVLAVSLLRIRRFDRIVRRPARVAPAAVQLLADGIGRQFGLRRTPEVVVTSAMISPMTWWTGRRAIVVMPERLIDGMPAAQLRWVLAHELAHVKRHDHLVRWLEWLACVLFWWNPVAWWARRMLRMDEEASCDAYVLEHLDRQPRSYARALLAVVELLARPPVRPPAVATSIDGGSLEHRFRLIVSTGSVRRAPRALVAAILTLAVVSMPLGLGAASRADVDIPPPALATPATRATAASDIHATGPTDTAVPAFRLLSTALAKIGDGEGVLRAERQLRVAERKLQQVERAQRSGRPYVAVRSLQEARRAVRQAAQAMEGSNDPPASVKRDLREARQALRQAIRAMRETRQGA